MNYGIFSFCFSIVKPREILYLWFFRLSIWWWSSSSGGCTNHLDPVKSIYSLIFYTGLVRHSSSLVGYQVWLWITFDLWSSHWFWVRDLELAGQHYLIDLFVIQLCNLLDMKTCFLLFMQTSLRKFSVLERRLFSSVLCFWPIIEFLRRILGMLWIFSRRSIDSCHRVCFFFLRNLRFSCTTGMLHTSHLFHDQMLTFIIYSNIIWKRKETKMYFRYIYIC